jgi:hypothetical protein
MVAKIRNSRLTGPVCAECPGNAVTAAAAAAAATGRARPGADEVPSARAGLRAAVGLPLGFLEGSFCEAWGGRAERASRIAEADDYMR